jgi:hypothetical protein
MAELRCEQAACLKTMRTGLSEAQKQKIPPVRLPGGFLA